MSHVAKLGASMNHPNLVSVYDYGTDEALDVRELVVGGVAQKGEVESGGDCDDEPDKAETEQRQLRQNIPQFKAGDTVRVVEGDFLGVNLAELLATERRPVRVRDDGASGHRLSPRRSASPGSSEARKSVCITAIGNSVAAVHPSARARARMTTSFASAGSPKGSRRQR